MVINDSCTYLRWAQPLEQIRQPAPTPASRKVLPWSPMPCNQKPILVHIPDRNKLVAEYVEDHNKDGSIVWPVGRHKKGRWRRKWIEKANSREQSEHITNLAVRQSDEWPVSPLQNGNEWSNKKQSTWSVIRVFGLHSITTHIHNRPRT